MAKDGESLGGAVLNPFHQSIRQSPHSYLRPVDDTNLSAVSDTPLPVKLPRNFHSGSSSAPGPSNSQPSRGAFSDQLQQNPEAMRIELRRLQESIRVKRQYLEEVNKAKRSRWSNFTDYNSNKRPRGRNLIARGRKIFASTRLECVSLKRVKERKLNISLASTRNFIVMNRMSTSNGFIHVGTLVPHFYHNSATRRTFHIISLALFIAISQFLPKPPTVLSCFARCQNDSSPDPTNTSIIIRYVQLRLYSSRNCVLACPQITFSSSVSYLGQFQTQRTDEFWSVCCEPTAFSICQSCLRPSSLSEHSSTSVCVPVHRHLAQCAWTLGRKRLTGTRH